jgi:hypothetical protein
VNLKTGNRRAHDRADRMTRLHMVPFTVTIPKPRRDKTLTDRLLSERDGILAWAVQGCLDWQRQGLMPPTAVQAATQEYFDDEDALGRWMCRTRFTSEMQPLRSIRDAPSAAAASAVLGKIDFRMWSTMRGAPRPTWSTASQT